MIMTILGSNIVNVNIVNLFLLAVLSAHGAIAARQLISTAVSTTDLDDVMSYWKQALPGTEMPGNLQEIVSPLSSSLVSLFSDHIKQTNSGPHDVDSFCKAASISCDAEEFDQFRSMIDEHDFPQWIPTSRPLRGTVQYKLNSDGKKVRKHADFFRESELVMGSHLALGYERDHNPERAFLPHSLAHSIGPISIKKLPQLLRELGIAENSRLANEMTTTTVGCNMEPLKGEIRKCVTSIEDMVDFVRSEFAAGHIEVLTVGGRISASTHMKNLQVRPATVTKVVQSSSSESKSMVCHNEMYSYALYYCHDIGNTRVYTVTLQDDDDKAITKNLIALCHQDTSQWTPEHVAFYDLAVKPGESEACHWIHERDVVFADAH